jgi:FixJ family two-component response regulator
MRKAVNASSIGVSWPQSRRGQFVPKMPLIAVIDDDESFRTSLVELLCLLGYGVRDFASAEAFVEEGGDRSCDGIITDIQLPGMSGLDLARLLTVRNPKIPIIMITAREEPELETRARLNGAACLVRKPFELKALVAFLEIVLGV